MVGESFHHMVAGVRTVTIFRKGATAQKLLRLFAFPGQPLIPREIPAKNLERKLANLAEPPELLFAVFSLPVPMFRNRLDEFGRKVCIDWAAAADHAFLCGN